MRFILLLMAVGLSGFGGSQLLAQATITTATDNGSNYSGGWNSGSNGGTGFQAWNIWSLGGTGGFAGNFVGNPSGGGVTGMATNSFGLYANPTGSGASANAERGLNTALAIGQTLSFQWGINFDSGSSGNKGFNLYSGGVEIFNINNGGTAAITCNGTDVGFGYGTAVMTWSFTRQNATTISITANDRDGNGSFSTNVVVSNGAIDKFRFYASSMQGGDLAQPYFNNFTVSEPVATSMAVPGNHAFAGTWQPDGRYGTGMARSTNPATPNLWELVFDVVDAKPISFKFAANNSWDFSWGMDPARPGYAKRGGDPITFTIPATGAYKFTFDQSTLAYSIARADKSTFTTYQKFADFYYLTGGPSGDFDKDGLTNTQEYDLGTDPTNADSDGDTLTDAWESGYGRYQIISGSFTWDQAKADAESRGGYLATITSRAESAFLLASFGAGNSGAPDAGLTDLWLGGTDEGSEGTWRWVTREAWSYTNWAFNMPDGGTGQNYLRYKEGWDDWFPTPTFNTYPVTVRGYLLEKGYPSAALNSDTDADGLPDWWEASKGLDPNSIAGGNGSLDDPDGDGFNNKQEFEGQSNPLSAASVPANRPVSFTLNLSRQITAGTFSQSGSTVEVWGTFNDWGNFTNRYSLTNNGSGEYSGTYVVPGAVGATNRYKFVTYDSNNTLSWEPGSDRPLVMGASGVATNLPVAYLGEVRPVTFSVNMSVQEQLGNFTVGGTNKVFVVGTDIPGGWDTGTELTPDLATGIYSGTVWISGKQGDASNFKFKANNNYELGADTRVLSLGARDVAQTIPIAIYNNTTLRTVTFAVNMNVQTNTNKLSFNPAVDTVEIRGEFNNYSGGLKWRLTNNGSGIFSGSFPVPGTEGKTNGYKYVAVVGTNANFERVDVPRTNSLANRTFVIGPANVSQVVHSEGLPAFFSLDDGLGPVITLKDKNPFNLNAGNPFLDPGASVVDLLEGAGADITGIGTVNPNLAGTYTLTYSASDAAGNPAEPVTRTVVVTGSTFAGWSGDDTLATLNSENLAKYAIGGAISLSATDAAKPTSTVSGGYLILTAIVRTDDSKLTVVGESVSDLADYAPDGTVSTVYGMDADDQTGVPLGHRRRTFAVEQGLDSKKFLRLKATLSP